MLEDYYKILDLERDATLEEIKRSYLKLARRYHPDVNPKEDKSGEKFKQVNRAYVLLSNSNRRRMYDAIRDVEKDPFKYQKKETPISRRTWSVDIKEGVREDSNVINFSKVNKSNKHKGIDPFSDLRNIVDLTEKESDTIEGEGSPSFRRGEDLRYDLEICFMDAFNGTKKKFKFRDPKTGDIKSLIIHLGRGVYDNYKLRLEGKGMPGKKGGESGDLYVVVHVKKHPKFRRIEDDIYISREIKYSTAILGGKIKAEGIEGNLRVNVPPLTKDSSLLKVRQKGFYNLESQKRGDLFIEVRIKVPESLNEKQKEEIEDLKNLGL
jgi:curved DNA-binding protein